MASTRKRPTVGFSSEEKLEEEKKQVEEFVEQTSEEILESLSEQEVTVQPFVEQEIIPTPDAGPRFLDKVEEQVVESQPETTVVVSNTVQLPKRHPRNIPKFSRNKQ